MGSWLRLSILPLTHNIWGNCWRWNVNGNLPSSLQRLNSLWYTAASADQIWRYTLYLNCRGASNANINSYYRKVMADHPLPNFLHISYFMTISADKHGSFLKYFFHFIQWSRCTCRTVHNCTGCLKTAFVQAAVSSVTVKPSGIQHCSLVKNL